MPTEWGTPTTQATVLQAVVDRLRGQISQLSGENVCFLSMSPEPIHEERQNLFATVCPLGGTYDDEIFDGSGSVNELTGVIVTVWSGMKIDRPSSHARMLTDEARGVLTLKQKILATLSGHALLDGNGNKILVRPMRPFRSGHPQIQDEEKGSFSVSFTTDFIWDLTATG